MRESRPVNLRRMPLRPHRMLRPHIPGKLPVIVAGAAYLRLALSALLPTLLPALAALLAAALATLLARLRAAAILLLLLVLLAVLVTHLTAADRKSVV